LSFYFFSVSQDRQQTYIPRSILKPTQHTYH